PAAEAAPVRPADPGRSCPQPAAGVALRQSRFLMPRQTRPADTKLRDWIASEAEAAGFDAVGIAAADAAPQAGSRLAEFLALGRHGTMGWMETTRERRSSVRALWPQARSVIVLGMNYGPAHDPLAILRSPDRGAISVYAQNRDYHDLIKGRLKGIAGRLVARTGAEVKVFVD